MKGVVKLVPPATIVVVRQSTLRGISMGTLTVRAADAKGFLHDILLPAMNVPGLCRHLFLGGAVVLREVNIVIAKESYLDVGQFEIPLRKDTNCPTIDYPSLELAPRDHGTVPDDGHLGAHNTDGVGSGLPTPRERDHGGGGASRNSGTTVHRDNDGGARSSSATEFSFSSWRAPGQWWHHGGGFGVQSDYVFRGAHNYARAGNVYNYLYTVDVGNCHGGGGERTSGTSALDIQTSAPYRPRGTSPRWESTSPTH